MIPVRLSLGEWSPVIRRIADPAAVAITFDDGPDPASTPHLIEALAAANAKASFFVCGVRVEQYPELIQALVEAGHDVYAHGWEHRDYAGSEATEAVAATARTEALLARHRPTPETYLVRLPFNAGCRSVAVHRAMRTFHPDIQFAWWSHSIADYYIADRPRAEAEVKEACEDVAARLEHCQDLGGGILLLHDAAITQPREAATLATRLLLPMVLQALKRRGLRGIKLRPRTEHSSLARFAFLSTEPLIIKAASLA